MQYIKENKNLVFNLYTQLFNNEVINTITHSLSFFLMLCTNSEIDGVKIFYNSAEEYSRTNSTKIFKELVQFIDNPIFDIKINTLTLICQMFEGSDDSSFKAKLIVHFNAVDLNSILEKNIDCNSSEFQIQLSNYRKYYDQIIKSSNFQVNFI